MAHRGGFPKKYSSKRSVRRWLSRYHREKPKGTTEINRHSKALAFLEANPSWKRIYQ